MKFSFLFPILCIISMLGCKSPEKLETDEEKITSPYTFNFMESNNLTDVIDQAVSEDKLVFVDIYADWCLPCKLMDKDVFTDRRLAEYFNENFINYKVDAETPNGADLVYLYNVQGYPTLLFLDGKGRVLERKDGAAYQTEMYRLADEALLKAGKSTE